VHVAADDQQETVMRLAGKGTEKFSTVPWTADSSGQSRCADDSLAPQAPTRVPFVAAGHLPERQEPVPCCRPRVQCGGHGI
jgi:hypothetical protein